MACSAEFRKRCSNQSYFSPSALDSLSWLFGVRESCALHAENSSVCWPFLIDSPLNPSARDKSRPGEVGFEGTQQKAGWGLTVPGFGQFSVEFGLQHCARTHPYFGPSGRSNGHCLLFPRLARRDAFGDCHRCCKDSLLCIQQLGFSHW